MQQAKKKCLILAISLVCATHLHAAGFFKSDIKSAVKSVTAKAAEKTAAQRAAKTGEQIVRETAERLAKETAAEKAARLAREKEEHIASIGGVSAEVRHAINALEDFAKSLSNKIESERASIYKQIDDALQLSADNIDYVERNYIDNPQRDQVIAILQEQRARLFKLKSMRAFELDLGFEEAFVEKYLPFADKLSATDKAKLFQYMRDTTRLENLPKEFSTGWVPEATEQLQKLKNSITAQENKITELQSNLKDLQKSLIKKQVPGLEKAQPIKRPIRSQELIAELQTRQAQLSRIMRETESNLRAVRPQARSEIENRLKAAFPGKVDEFIAQSNDALTKARQYIEARRDNIDTPELKSDMDDAIKLRNSTIEAADQSQRRLMQSLADYDDNILKNQHREVIAEQEQAQITEQLKIAQTVLPTKQVPAIVPSRERLSIPSRPPQGVPEAAATTEERIRQLQARQRELDETITTAEQFYAAIQSRPTLLKQLREQFPTELDAFIVQSDDAYTKARQYVGALRDGTATDAMKKEAQAAQKARNDMIAAAPAALREPMTRLASYDDQVVQILETEVNAQKAQEQITEQLKAAQTELTAKKVQSASQVPTAAPAAQAAQAMPETLRNRMLARVADLDKESKDAQAVTAIDELKGSPVYNAASAYDAAIKAEKTAIENFMASKNQAESNARIDEVVAQRRVVDQAKVAYDAERARTQPPAQATSSATVTAAATAKVVRPISQDAKKEMDDRIAAISKDAQDPQSILLDTKLAGTPLATAAAAYRDALRTERTRIQKFLESTDPKQQEALYNEVVRQQIAVDQAHQAYEAQKARGAAARQPPAVPEEKVPKPTEQPAVKTQPSAPAAATPGLTADHIAQLKTRQAQLVAAQQRIEATIQDTIRQRDAAVAQLRAQYPQESEAFINQSDDAFYKGMTYLDALEKNKAFTEMHQQANDALSALDTIMERETNQALWPAMQRLSDIDSKIMQAATDHANAVLEQQDIAQQLAGGAAPAGERPAWMPEVKPTSRRMPAAAEEPRPAIPTVVVPPSKVPLTKAQMTEQIHKKILDVQTRLNKVDSVPREQRAATTADLERIAVYYRKQQDLVEHQGRDLTSSDVQTLGKRAAALKAHIELRGVDVDSRFKPFIKDIDNEIDIVEKEAGDFSRLQPLVDALATDSKISKAYKTQLDKTVKRSNAYLADVQKMRELIGDLSTEKDILLQQRITTDPKARAALQKTINKNAAAVRALADKLSDHRVALDKDEALLVQTQKDFERERRAQTEAQLEVNHKAARDAQVRADRAAQAAQKAADDAAKKTNPQDRKVAEQEAEKDIEDASESVESASDAQVRVAYDDTASEISDMEDQLEHVRKENPESEPLVQAAEDAGEDIGSIEWELNVWNTSLEQIEHTKALIADNPRMKTSLERSRYGKNGLIGSREQEIKDRVAELEAQRTSTQDSFEQRVKQDSGLMAILKSKAPYLAIMFGVPLIGLLLFELASVVMQKVTS